MATTEKEETEETAETATGRIEEIQGVVIEATFPSGELPEIYNAVTVVRGGGRGRARR